MPWVCPKCGLHLAKHASMPDHEQPRVGTIYRCPVCRTELTFDPIHKKLTPVDPPPTGPEKPDAA
jgi:ribosomal protein L37AE/L43A